MLCLILLVAVHVPESAVDGVNRRRVAAALDEAVEPFGNPAMHGLSYCEMDSLNTRLREYALCYDSAPHLS